LDTDRDGLYDGQEAADAYWFEAEDVFKSPSSVLDPEAEAKGQASLPLHEIFGQLLSDSP
jgi:hypothetical protein